MRFTKRAMALAIAGLLAGGTASAQQPYQAAVPARQTAYEYDSYYAQEPEAAAKNDAAAPAAGDCGAEKNGCGEKNGCEENGCGAACADDAAPASNSGAAASLMPSVHRQMASPGSRSVDHSGKARSGMRPTKAPPVSSSSTNVFHSWHAGQRPIHLVSMWPQPVQP